MENLLITIKKRSKISKLLFMICFILLLVINCTKNEPEFENGLIEFEKYFSKKELDIFKNASEEIAIIKIKEGKNKYYESFFRHSMIGKKVSFFFEKKMIDDFDFMSDIMLACLHRKYHKEPYELEELIEEKRWEYNDFYYCIKKRKEKALFLFNFFELGDTIHLIQPIKEDHIYEIECPNTFINNDKLINLSGIILDKKVILDSLYFTTRIRLINAPIKKFYPMEGEQPISLGDTMTVYLNNAFLDYSKHKNFMFSY